MFGEKNIEFAIKIIQVFSINIIIFVVFFILFFIKIKIKKATWINAIDFRQNLISFSFSLFVFALLPINLAFFIWVGIYIFLREIIFRKDEIRKYQLYCKFGKNSGNPFPKIRKFSEFNAVFFPIDDIKHRYKEFKYSFISYSNTGLCLIISIFLKIAETSNTINIFYFIEVIIISSIIFMFLARFTYYISFHAPNSFSYLCERLSYIPVILVGLIYYFTIIVVLLKLHGTMLFIF